MYDTNRLLVQERKRAAVEANTPHLLALKHVVRDPVFFVPFCFPLTQDSSIVLFVLSHLIKYPIASPRHVIHMVFPLS
jgi:hypothetical protein